MNVICPQPIQQATVSSLLQGTGAFRDCSTYHGAGKKTYVLTCAPDPRIVKMRKIIQETWYSAEDYADLTVNNFKNVPISLNKAVHIQGNWVKHLLLHFGPLIEKLAGEDFGTVKAKYDAYGLGYWLYHYFEEVTDPKEGDLVLYKGVRGTFNMGGVYRAEGSCIESKGISGIHSFLFRHPPFFIETSRGEEIYFFRLRTGPRPQNLQGLTDIVELPYDYSSMSSCGEYAMGKLLKTYSPPEGPFHKPGHALLSKILQVQTDPNPGDLVVYDMENERRKATEITHYGIYLGEGWVESKWGNGGNIYQHPILCDKVKKAYGCKLTFYRFVSGLTAAQVIQQADEANSEFIEGLQVMQKDPVQTPE
jgi:cell wall-associated NlpC family hydrolase